MSHPIYFDYMATTPLDPEVSHYMHEVASDERLMGNPSAHAHFYGWYAKEAIAKAANNVAKLIGAKHDEIVWTSGATESINLALKGVCEHYQRQGNHIITLATEHAATLETCKALEAKGIEVTYLKPKADGLIDLDALQAAFRPTTLLVTLCHVNNEIGVIQDIKAISKLTHANGALLHVDAAQSLGKTPIHFEDWGVDFASISSHKVYGPKGIGALVVRAQPKRRLTPQIHGGGQQALRSGTLPTLLILGFAKACALASSKMAKECAQIAKWQQQCLDALLACPGVHLTGHSTKRVAHNIHVTVDDVHGESLLLALNRIAIASGSACNSASPKPSHVLGALGMSRKQSLTALRITLGRMTTQQDIGFLIDYFPKTLAELRRIAP